MRIEATEDGKIHERRTNNKQKNVEEIPEEERLERLTQRTRGRKPEGQARRQGKDDGKSYKK